MAHPTSIRLGDEEDALLTELSEKLGVTKAAVVTMAMKLFARRIKNTMPELWEEVEQWDEKE